MRFVLLALIGFAQVSRGEVFQIRVGAEEEAKTLYEAARKVAEVRSSSPDKKIEVLVTEGRYFLDETLVLNKRHGGIEGAPVVWRGEGEVLVSGGVELAGFSENAQGMWEARVLDGLHFEQLWVNDERAVRARFPDQGVLEFQAVEENRMNRSLAEHVIQLPKDRLPGIQTFEGRGTLVGTVYHKWDSTRRAIESYDAENGILTIVGSPPKPWNGWDADSAVILENEKSLLSVPGEWFLGDGLLTYIPREGDEIESARVVAPRLGKLLEIEGGSAADRVEYVTFDGIDFGETSWVAPDGGFGPEQAAASIGAAIEVKNANHIVFKNCGISRTAKYGIWFREGTRGCSVQHCEITDLGAGGLRAGETEFPASGKECEGHVFSDIQITSGGHVFPCAVGVLITHSGKNTVVHNEIGHFPYTGVSVGWHWGYGDSAAKENQIKYNHIHHIGDGRLSDLGGIYTLGRSEGTVIKGNHIHDILAKTYGGWGLYTDEGSSGILMENNLVHHTRTGGFHQHYGKDNVIRNNILAYGTEGQVQFTRAEGHNSFTFEQNIVLWKEGELLGHAGWKEGNVTMNRNLYWKEDGSKPYFGERTFEEWRMATGNDLESLIADPRFADPANGNYEIENPIAIREIGFVPFDVSNAGPREVGDE